MPFCAAAAVIDGHVGIETFENRSAARSGHRVADGAGDHARRSGARSVAPSLTQARIRVRLKDGSELTALADGARGYADRPASDQELAVKFLACAERAIPHDRAFARSPCCATSNTWPTLAPSRLLL